MGQSKCRKEQIAPPSASVTPWGPLILTVLASCLLETSWSTFWSLNHTDAVPGMRFSQSKVAKHGSIEDGQTRYDNTTAWQSGDSNSSTVGQRLVSWARHHGAVVNVDVLHAAGQGHYTIASKNLQKGDVIVRMPLNLCTPQHPQGYWVSATLLWQDLHDPNARLKPYYDALPKRSELISYDRLPESYIPLIQNQIMENATRSLHKYTREWHQYHKKGKKLFNSMTVDDLSYSITLIRSRAFGTERGPTLLPIIDMANHHSDCPHKLTGWPPELCGDGDPEGCIVLEAGAAVTAGQEICYAYTPGMLQDEAVLQYGFLQGDRWALEMSGIDRHDFESHRPWHFKSAAEYTSTGDQPAQYDAEIKRLTNLLSDMQHLDRDLQIHSDPAKDPDGWYLQVLLQWRRQRKAAIAAELKRLRAIAAAYAD